MLIPSLSNFLPDHPRTSRRLDQFSISFHFSILIQELQEYFDHILLQLVDMVGVLLQGVTNRCLEMDGVLIDDVGGAGVLLLVTSTTDDYCGKS